MCGIAGFAGFKDRSGAERGVLRMMCSLARRGPDAEGMETWDGAVLGHRRLSIFDLSELGRQPMFTPDRSLGVVFIASSRSCAECSLLRYGTILRRN
jgi:asparagine synthase (glutamine-hydrolysing)